VAPYYPDDDHWSPEGHQIAAEAINDYLSSIDGGGTPAASRQARLEYLHR